MSQAWLDGFRESQEDINKYILLTRLSAHMIQLVSVFTSDSEIHRIKSIRVIFPSHEAECLSFHSFTFQYLFDVVRTISL